MRTSFRRRARASQTHQSRELVCFRECGRACGTPDDTILLAQPPAAIWTTYPVATAHVIGYALARLSGLPWVADFRDPMLYEAWPEEPFARRAAAWAERLTVCRCARAVVVTESALQLYRERYAN